MKEMTIKLFVPVFLLSVLFYGCGNKYEKAAIGEYKLLDYKTKDNKVADTNIGTVSLTLSENKTFLFAGNKKTLKGNWKAGDDGDRTWIRFYFESKTSDGIIVGDSLNIVEIWNPQDFGYSSFSSLSLKR